MQLYFVEQLVLLHVKDTNSTTYVCDILFFIATELSDVYVPHVMYRLGL